jgi:hypothetical protein
MEVYTANQQCSLSAEVQSWDLCQTPSDAANGRYSAKRAHDSLRYILLQQVFVQEPGTRRTLVAPFRAIHDHEVPGTLSQPHRLTGVKPSSIVRPSILRLGCWQGMVPGMVPLAGNADTTDSSYTTAFSAEDLLTSYDVRWR